MPELFIYDTKSRRKIRFEPIIPDKVSIYVCGPTVYDRVHIGNALPGVVFDVFARLLRAMYREVKYVRNITDIDDKINQAALDAGVPISEWADRYTRALEEDFAALFISKPDAEPRATHHVVEIIQLIEGLIESGFAYVAEGHVLFEVSTDPNYGSLSNRTLEEMIDGARVEVAPYKRDPKDFVLWKPSTPDLPGWESPWGRGRPGWHIECSAMIFKHLDAPIDIHGGGSDLMFPHHENEMAQGTCITDKDSYVRYWMHNGMLNFGGRKMSKSLGNIQSIHALLKEHSGEVLRYALLSGHYRQSLNWDDQLLGQSQRSVEALYQALRTSEIRSPSNLSPSSFANSSIDEFPTGVVDALCDDINSPRALAAMHGIATELNKTNSLNEIEALRSQLLGGAWLLGLLNTKIDEYFQSSDIPSSEIEQLIQERAEARKSRDFERADEIREDLANRGIILEDTATGTVWKKSSD